MRGKKTPSKATKDKKVAKKKTNKAEEIRIANTNAAIKKEFNSIINYSKMNICDK